MAQQLKILMINSWVSSINGSHDNHTDADLITLASILRKPVCMHNVEDKNIFRPATWNGFGTDKVLIVGRARISVLYMGNQFFRELHLEIS